MCGILGYIGESLSSKLVVARLNKISHRGKDNYGITEGSKTEKNISSNKLELDVKGEFFLAHALHSIIDFVSQPIENNFVANCEIYNWKDLANKHGLDVKNDAELFYQLLSKEGITCLDELDGDYTFAWKQGAKLFLARDIIGVKPVWWYAEGKGLWFASENKALDFKGQLLDPRKILVFENGNFSFIERSFSIPQTKDISKENAAQKVADLLKRAVEKRLAGINKIGILFSGGVDSTALAVIAKFLKKEVTLYTAGFEDSEDVLWAKKIAATLELPLKMSIAKNIQDIESEAKSVIGIIETHDVMKVGVALPFHLACRLANKDGCKVILSGLGSEEIFAGYQRHKQAKDVNAECVHGLLSMHERDLFRDDAITMANNLELRVPFLDSQLINFALSIPGNMKIVNGLDKAILRDAAVLLGVPKESAMRKKRAAQYGSGMDKAIAKLTKKAKFHTKKEYLDSLD